MTDGVGCGAGAALRAVSLGSNYSSIFIIRRLDELPLPPQLPYIGTIKLLTPKD